MRTIAQFSIRDPDGTDSQITEVPENRMRHLPSTRRTSQAMTENGMLRKSDRSPVENGQNYASLPTGVSEMPANYESSIMESPPLPLAEDRRGQRANNTTPPFPHTYSNPTEQEESDVSAQHSPIDLASSYHPANHPDRDRTPQAELPAFEYDPAPPIPRYDSKPTFSLPSVTGHDTLNPASESDLRSLPSQSRFSFAPSIENGGDYDGYSGDSGRTGGGAKGLRVANANEDEEDEEEEEEEEEARHEWPTEAIMHMNLSSGGNQKVRRERDRERERERYDGSGYGSAM